jgi:hypothetical protein
LERHRLRSVHLSAYAFAGQRTGWEGSVRAPRCSPRPTGPSTASWSRSNSGAAVTDGSLRCRPADASTTFGRVPLGTGGCHSVRHSPAQQLVLFTLVSPLSIQCRQCVLGAFLVSDRSPEMHIRGLGRRARDGWIAERFAWPDRRPVVQIPRPARRIAAAAASALLSSTSMPVLALIRAATALGSGDVTA